MRPRSTLGEAPCSSVAPRTATATGPRGIRLDIVLPALALCAYLAVVGFRGIALSDATFSYADAPEGAYLASALFGSPIRLPLHSELVPGLVEAALLHAPSAHVLIQLLGPLLGLIAVAVACLAVRRLGGRWWLTAATGAAMGPIALWSTLFPTAHVYTLVCLAALALAIIAMARHRLGPVQAVLMGVLCGSAVLGDQGFVLEGLVPLGVTVVTLRFITRSSAAGRSAAIVVVAAAATTAVGALALIAGGVHTVFALTPGSSSSNTLGSSVSTVVHTLSAMAAGRWYGEDPGQLLGAFTALMGTAIALVAPITCVVTVRRRPRDPGRIAYLMFWACSDVIILTAFVALGYGGAPIEGHYLIPCLFSAVATVPLLVPDRKRGVAGVLAAAFVIVQAAGVLVLPAASFELNSARPLAPILAVIRQQGLTRGYSDYWISHPLTWLSNDTVHVYPVQQRQCEGGVRICPYQYSADAWYEPSLGRTFLLVTEDNSCVDVAPASLGQPERRVAINATTTLVVYGYDIAARFDTTPVPLC